MFCPDSLFYFKLLTFVGMCFAAGGTILLWRSSPSGYALSGYGSATVIAENNKNNQRMARKQKLAILFIVLGTVFQIPLLVCS